MPTTCGFPPRPSYAATVPVGRSEARHPVTVRVRHLDAEGVADDVQEQAEVATGDASVGDGVGGQLGDEERGRVQRHSPGAELLGCEETGEAGSAGRGGQAHVEVAEGGAGGVESAGFLNHVTQRGDLRVP